MMTRIQVTTAEQREAIEQQAARCQQEILRLVNMMEEYVPVGYADRGIGVINRLHDLARQAVDEMAYRAEKDGCRGCPIEESRCSMCGWAESRGGVWM